MGTSIQQSAQNDEVLPGSSEEDKSLSVLTRVERAAREKAEAAKGKARDVGESIRNTLDEERSKTIAEVEAAAGRTIDKITAPISKFFTWIGEKWTKGGRKEKAQVLVGGAAIGLAAWGIFSLVRSSLKKEESSSSTDTKEKEGIFTRWFKKLFGLDKATSAVDKVRKGALLASVFAAAGGLGGGGIAALWGYMQGELDGLEGDARKARIDEIVEKLPVPGKDMIRKGLYAMAHVEEMTEGLKTKYDEWRKGFEEFCKKKNLPFDGWLDSFEDMYSEYIGEHSVVAGTGIGAILGFWFIRKGAPALVSGGKLLLGNVVTLGLLTAFVAYFFLDEEQKKTVLEKLGKAAKTVANIAVDVAVHSGLLGKEMIPFERKEEMLRVFTLLQERIAKTDTQSDSPEAKVHAKLLEEVNAALRQLKTLEPGLTLTLDFRPIFTCMRLLFGVTCVVEGTGKEASYHISWDMVKGKEIIKFPVLAEDPQLFTPETVKIAAGYHLNVIRGFFAEQGFDGNTELKDWLNQNFTLEEVTRVIEVELKEKADVLKEYGTEIASAAILVILMGKFMNKAKAARAVLTWGSMFLMAKFGYDVFTKGLDQAVNWKQVANFEAAMGNSWRYLMEQFHVDMHFQSLLARLDSGTELMPEDAIEFLNQTGLRMNDMAVRDEGVKAARLAVSELQELVGGEDDEKFAGVRDTLGKLSGYLDVGDASAVTLFSGDLAYIAYWARQEKGLDVTVVPENGLFTLCIGDICLPGLSKNPLGNEYITTLELKQKMQRIGTQGLQRLASRLDDFDTDADHTVQGERYAANIKAAMAAIKVLHAALESEGFAGFQSHRNELATLQLALQDTGCPLVIRGGEMYVTLPDKREINVGLDPDSTPERFKEIRNLIGEGAGGAILVGAIDTMHETNIDVARALLLVAKENSALKETLERYLANPDLIFDPAWLAKLCTDVLATEGWGIKFLGGTIVVIGGSFSFALNAIESTCSLAWDILQHIGQIREGPGYKETLSDFGGGVVLLASPLIGSFLAGGIAMIPAKALSAGTGATGVAGRVGWRIGSMPVRMARAIATSPATLNRIAQNPVEWAKLKLRGGSLKGLATLGRTNVVSMVSRPAAIWSVETQYVETARQVEYYKNVADEAIFGRGAKLEKLAELQESLVSELHRHWKAQGRHDSRSQADERLKELAKNDPVVKRYSKIRGRGLFANTIGRGIDLFIERPLVQDAKQNLQMAREDLKTARNTLREWQRRPGSAISADQLDRQRKLITTLEKRVQNMRYELIQASRDTSHYQALRERVKRFSLKVGGKVWEARGEVVNVLMPVFLLVAGATSRAHVRKAQEQIRETRRKILADDTLTKDEQTAVIATIDEQLSILEWKEFAADTTMGSGGIMLAPTVQKALQALVENVSLFQKALPVIQKAAPLAAKLGRYGGPAFMIVTMAVEAGCYNFKEIPQLRESIDHLIENVPQMVERGELSKGEAVEALGLLQKQLSHTTEKKWIANIGFTISGLGVVVSMGTGLAAMAAWAPVKYMYDTAGESRDRETMTVLQWRNKSRNDLENELLSTAVDQNASEAYRLATDYEEIETERVSTRRRIVEAMILQKETSPEKVVQQRNFIGLMTGGTFYFSRYSDLEDAFHNAKIFTDALEHINVLDFSPEEESPIGSEVNIVVATLRQLEDPAKQEELRQIFSKPDCSYAPELRTAATVIMSVYRKSAPREKENDCFQEKVFDLRLGRLHKTLYNLAVHFGYSPDADYSWETLREIVFPESEKENTGIYWNSETQSWWVNRVYRGDVDCGNDNDTPERMVAVMEEYRDEILKPTYGGLMDDARLRKGLQFSTLGTAVNVFKGIIGQEKINTKGSFAKQALATKVDRMIELLGEARHFSRFA